MTEIIAKRNNTNIAKAEDMLNAFEPLRMMRDFWRMEPIRESNLWQTLAQRANAFEPSFDVKETPDAYLIKADVPGVADKDIEVSVHGNRLQITGKRHSETESKGETYYTCERTSGSFMRTFMLPADAEADKIQADLAAGVLSVRLAKRSESKVKQVPVNTKQ